MNRTSRGKIPTRSDSRCIGLFAVTFGDETVGFWLVMGFGWGSFLGGSIWLVGAWMLGLGQTQGGCCNRRATTTAPALDRSPSGDETERFWAVHKACGVSRDETRVKN